MKKISILTALSKEDQTKILELCQHLSYVRVVEMIAKPRDEGGLGIQTSRSTLCRFNQSCNPFLQSCHGNVDFALSINALPGANRDQTLLAIIEALQGQLLRAISNDVPDEQLARKYRTILNFRRSFLAMQKWRDLHKEETLPKLRELDAAPEEANPVDNVPAPAPAAPSHHPTQPAPAPKLQLHPVSDLLSKARSMPRPLAMSEEDWNDCLAFLEEDAALQRGEIVPQNFTKSPDISHISSNFTCAHA